MTIKDSIASKLDTCPKCNFTAIFMYKDVTGPICPLCNAAEIKEYKDQLKDLDLVEDELEESGYLYEEELEELNF